MTPGKTRDPQLNGRPIYGHPNTASPELWTAATRRSQQWAVHARARARHRRRRHAIFLIALAAVILATAAVIAYTHIT